MPGAWLKQLFWIVIVILTLYGIFTLRFVTTIPETETLEKGNDDDGRI